MFHPCMGRYWNRFENFCRDLALRYDEVSIISGPAFPVQQSTDGKKFVHYDVGDLTQKKVTYSKDQTFVQLLGNVMFFHLSTSPSLHNAIHLLSKGILFVHIFIR